MRPGQFLIIGGYYLNVNLVACFEPHYQVPIAGATPITQPKGGGIVRVWLDARAVQAYPGHATLPLFLDITQKAEMQHARRLLTGWQETGIATSFTQPLGSTQLIGAPAPAQEPAEIQRIRKPMAAATKAKLRAAAKARALAKGTTAGVPAAAKTRKGKVLTAGAGG